MNLEQIMALGVAYDPTTGVVTRDGVGVVAKRGRGYLSLNIAGEQFYVHRVAWLFVHGRWPDLDIDHINRNKTDNRIANLREATRSQNQRNHPITRANTSGIKGVRFNKQSRRWVAFMRIDTRCTHLGSFPNIEAAIRARLQAEQKHCGQFAYRSSASSANSVEPLASLGTVRPVTKAGSP